MRITSWNLLHGLPIPPDEEADPQALLSAALSQLATDVIGLQEVDYFLERSGNHNQTGNVASIVGAKDWAFAPSLMGSPDEDWRNPTESDDKLITNKSEVAPGSYGIGMASKFQFNRGTV